MSGRALPVFAPEQPAAAALALLRASLAANGTANAALDARCLVEAACGLDRAMLVAHGERPLGSSAIRLGELARRRLAGEPLARLLGEREFWGLGFALSAATLVPRPETETLVEAALRHCDAGRGRDHEWRLLDLGTGSGCIAIALLSELPRASAVCIDRAFEAVTTARRNAGRHGVAGRSHFLVGDWADAVSSSFDIVVSNPPYVTSRELAALDAEVREHDPRLALDGGADGLDAYRAIAHELPRLLAPGGRAFFEIGKGQDRAIRTILLGEGLAETSPHADLAGTTRVIGAGRGGGTRPPGQEFDF